MSSHLIGPLPRTLDDIPFVLVLVLVLENRRKAEDEDENEDEDEEDARLHPYGLALRKPPQ
jgi:hypothetical protein